MTLALPGPHSPWRGQVCQTGPPAQATLSYVQMAASLFQKTQPEGDEQKRTFPCPLPALPISVLESRFRNIWGFSLFPSGYIEQNHRTDFFFITTPKLECSTFKEIAFKSLGTRSKDVVTAHIVFSSSLLGSSLEARTLSFQSVVGIVPLSLGSGFFFFFFFWNQPKPLGWCLVNNIGNPFEILNGISPYSLVCLFLVCFLSWSKTSNKNSRNSYLTLNISGRHWYKELQCTDNFEGEHHLDV